MSEMEMNEVSVEGDRLADAEPNTEVAADEKSSGGNDVQGESTFATGESEQSGDSQEPKADESIPALDPELLLHAGRIGLSKEEALAFGNSDQLRAALTLIEQRDQRRQAEVNTGNVQTQAQNASAAEFELKLSDDIDPELKTAIDGMHNYYKVQFQAMSQQYNSIMDHMRTQASQEFRAWFDRTVEALPQEYKGIVGDKGAPKILEAMDIIAAGNQKFNRSVSRDDAFQQALRLAFGDKSGAIERAKIGETLKKQKKQFIGRPTHRDTKESISPEDKAMSSVAAKLAEFGV